MGDVECGTTAVTDSAANAGSHHSPKHISAIDNDVAEEVFNKPDTISNGIFNGDLQTSKHVNPTTNTGSSSDVTLDVGTDNIKSAAEDMLGFVSLDRGGRNDQRPATKNNDLNNPGRESSVSDATPGAYFLENTATHPVSAAHSLHKPEDNDVTGEDRVVDSFGSSDELLTGRPDTSSAYPVLNPNNSFFNNNDARNNNNSNNNNNNNNTETFDMIPVTAPRKASDLLKGKEVELDDSSGPAKHAITSSTTVDHAIYDDIKQNSSRPEIEKSGASDGIGPQTEGDGSGDGGAGREVVLEEEPMEKNLTPVRQLLSLWYVAVIVLVPIILLPLPLVMNSQEAKCAYVIFVMAIFWVTEAIPIPVTSLIPIFLLPMMGLVTARNTSAAYINDTSILFLGGLTVAIAIEQWNLHRRIALAVLMVVGSEPRWLMLGMMSVTWFLSMWISNTATTAMMLPIVQAVLQQITTAEANDDGSGDGGGDDCPTHRVEHHHVEMSPIVVEVNGTSEQKHTSGKLSKLTHRIRKYTVGSEKKDKQKAEEERDGTPESPKQVSMKQLGKALSLAIAYAANVGGIASLTGTGPNLVLLGQSQIVFEKVGLNTPITFATWLIYGLPLSLILVVIVWVWLQIIFLRCRGGCDCILKRGSAAVTSARNNKVREVIREEFRKLGPISYAEGTIIVFFALLVVLWITRDLGGVGGWGSIFPDGFVSDSTPAILVAVLMFILPSALPDIFFRNRRQGRGPRRPLTALMNWKILHEKMPWSLYLLLGGGFAIAQAAQESGLSLWLGEKLAVFGALDPWLMLFIICYIMTFVTEVTSNTAIATIMMPILAQLSLTLNLNPLFFMFPVAITTSFAFMLPVATPPNAIVFAFGAVRVIDMASTGFILNCLSVPCLMLATVTWGNAFFHFDVLPVEFLQNSTAIPPNVTSV